MCMCFGGTRASWPLGWCENLRQSTPNTRWGDRKHGTCIKWNTQRIEFQKICTHHQMKRHRKRGTCTQWDTQRSKFCQSWQCRWEGLSWSSILIWQTWPKNTDNKHRITLGDHLNTAPQDGRRNVWEAFMILWVYFSFTIPKIPDRSNIQNRRFAFAQSSRIWGPWYVRVHTTRHDATRYMGLRFLTWW